MVESDRVSGTDFAGGLACLRFDVSGEHYALPLVQVSSVQLVGPITRVPGASPLIQGIIELRGMLLPVLNLARVLGLAEAQQQGQHMVVVRAAGQELGLLVDEAQDILNIDPAEVEPRLSTLTGERAEFVEGQVHTRLGLVGLLKLERIVEAVRLG